MITRPVLASLPSAMPSLLQIRTSRRPAKPMQQGQGPVSAPAQILNRVTPPTVERAPRLRTHRRRRKSLNQVTLTTTKPAALPDVDPRPIANPVRPPCELDPASPRSHDPALRKASRQAMERAAPLPPIGPTCRRRRAGSDLRSDRRRRSICRGKLATRPGPPDGSGRAPPEDACRTLTAQRALARDEGETNEPERSGRPQPDAADLLVSGCPRAASPHDTRGPPRLTTPADHLASRRIGLTGL
jgi:hypothetical protein